MSNKKHVMNVKKTAKRLKELRENKGLSHIKLAKALIKKYHLKGRDGGEMSSESLKTSLMKYEETEEYHDNYGAVAGMATNTLFMLADYYGISVDYLLGISNFPSVNEDFKKVNKITGLSVKAIEVLKKEAEEIKKIPEEIDVYNTVRNQGFNAMNYLIENDLEYNLFNSLYNYLWFRMKNKKLIELKKPIINDDFGYTMTVNQWEKVTKLEVDTILESIKADIEEGKNGKHTSKKK